MPINFPQDFNVASLAGKVQGVSQLVIAGRSANIQTVDPPLTIGFGSGLQPFPSAQESWEILSSDANDTAAGTGARTVLVQYLDGNYAQQQALIVLNGVTPVAIAANCLRHQSSVVVTAGSGTVNAGTLTIRVADGGATRAIVGPTRGSARQGSFTIPDGFIGVIHSTAFIVGRSTGPGVLATIEAHLIDAQGVQRVGLDFTVSEPGLNLTFPGGISIPERNTLDYRVTAVSANGVDVSVLTSGFLVNVDTLQWPLT